MAAGMGGQFCDDGYDEPRVPDVRRRRRGRPRKRTWKVVLDQSDRETPERSPAARHAEQLVLLRKVARLQAVQTVVVCAAALVCVGVVLCRW